MRCDGVRRGRGSQTAVSTDGRSGTELRGGARTNERPRPIRVPALHASGAGWGISRACGALAFRTSRFRTRRFETRAPGGGIRQSSDQRRGGGRSGNDGATGAALHSVGSGVGPGCGVVGKNMVWPVILRHRGRGHGRSLDHRPLGGCSSLVGGGRTTKAMNRQLYGVEVTSSALQHSRRNGRPGQRDLRRRSLRHSLGGDEVRVGGPPHTARRRARAPAARALRTAPSKIRSVAGEQSTPPVRQTRQFASCHRQQRPVIGAGRQLIEHVEPVPNRLPEDLAQNPVHLATFPAAHRVFPLTRGPVSQPHTHIVPGTKPVMTLRCADRQCYDGERQTLIGGADQLCRSALHQPLRTCLRCMRRPSDGKGAR